MSVDQDSTKGVNPPWRIMILAELKEMKPRRGRPDTSIKPSPLSRLSVVFWRVVLDDVSGTTSSIFALFSACDDNRSETKA